MASVAGLGGQHQGIMQTVAYNASKGGVVNLTRALAADWAHIPIPKDSDLLERLVKAGEQVARLLDVNRDAGDVVVLRDARGSKRKLILEAVHEPADSGGFMMTARKTTYLEAGTALRAETADPQSVSGMPSWASCMPARKSRRRPPALL